MSENASLPARVIGKIFGFLIPLAVLLGAVLGARALILAKPEIPKATRREDPVFVELMQLERSDRRLEVKAFGTVVPHRELEVQNQVMGRVTQQHPGLVEGGLVPAGAELVRIDDRDYRFEVEQAEARVRTAEAQLEVEMGRQAIAKREFELLKETVQQNQADERLALRKPFLMQREADLAAARSALSFRKTQLERTVIKAPFAGLVIEEQVEPDRLLTMGARLGRIVATDVFRVVVTLPMGDLDQVALPDAEGAGGSPVTVSLDLGRGREATWPGRVVKVLGQVSQAGRLARVMVLVDDPLGLEAAHAGRQRLLLGSYVQVAIGGPAIEGVYAIPRGALRLGDVVWAMGENDRLEVLPVTIARRTATEVWISEGLEGDERIVTSALAVAAEGLLLTDGDEGGSTEGTMGDQAAGSTSGASGGAGR